MTKRHFSSVIIIDIIIITNNNAVLITKNVFSLEYSLYSSRVSGLTKHIQCACAKGVHQYIISYFKPWPRGLKKPIIYQFIIKYNIDINGKID